MNKIITYVLLYNTSILFMVPFQVKIYIRFYMNKFNSCYDVLPVYRLKNFLLSAAYFSAGSMYRTIQRFPAALSAYHTFRQNLKVVLFAK